MAEVQDIWSPLAPYVRKSSTAGGIETRIIYGQISDSSVDIDMQRTDPEWLKEALAEWWTWRNIQAGHNGPDVGTGIELTKDADAWMCAAEIVDPLAIAKVDKGVYQGLSIGVKWPKVHFKDASAPMGTLCGGKIVHVALCGRPANENSRITAIKSGEADDTTFVLGKGAYADVDAETVEEAEQIVKAASVNTDDRNEMADKGWALPDGSYPIPDVPHLKSAVILAQSGHGDVEAAKRLIKRRARALNAEDEIPDSWKAATTSADELSDATLAKQAVDVITQLIAREAAEVVADGDTGDLYDIDILRTALTCLEGFISGEMSEAAMMGFPKDAQASVFKTACVFLGKAGARNSAADTQRIQAIHDHTGSLGAKASDECQANAGSGDGDDDMDEKSVQAMIDAFATESLPKAVQDALTAAGVTSESFKAAQSQQIADVTELVKRAVSPLEERMAAIEGRAEEGGPLIMAVQRGLHATQRSAEKAALAEQVTSLWRRAQTHQDPSVRTEAVLEYSRVKAQLDALGD